MKKILTTLAVLALLAGCSTAPRKIEITGDTKGVGVPILYCPAPPKLEHPPLPIKTMTADNLKVDGEVAKAYVASVQTLVDYLKETDRVLKQYQDDHDAYDAQITKLKDDWKKATGHDLDLSSVPSNSGEMPAPVKPTNN